MEAIGGSGRPTLCALNGIAAEKMLTTDLMAAGSRTTPQRLFAYLAPS
jgi:hypothetical protein